MTETPSTSVLVRELLGPVTGALVAGNHPHLNNARIGEVAVNIAEATAEAFQRRHVLRRKEHLNGNGRG